MPRRAATSEQKTSAIGNGMLQFVVTFESVNPAAPANAAWASEIWPRYPVMTTYDSASSIRMIEYVRPNR